MAVAAEIQASVDLAAPPAVPAVATAVTAAATAVVEAVANRKTTAAAMVPMVMCESCGELAERFRLLMSVVLLPSDAPVREAN